MEASVDLVSDEGPFLIDGTFLLSSCSGWAPKLMQAPFIRELIPVMRQEPSQPNHLPHALPLNTVTFGVRFQRTNFGGV